MFRFEDVEEVSSYIQALEYGIQKIRSGFPICLRLFKEVHAVLLATGRGATKQTRRIPPKPELDWRQQAWQCPFRTASSRQTHGVSRSLREIFTQ